MTKKPKTKSKPLDVAAVIDRIADREGINPSDVLKFPKLLKAEGVNPLAVEPGDITQAELIHRAAMREIIQRHGANKPKPLDAPPNELTLPPATRRTPEAQTTQDYDPEQETLFGESVESVIRWMGSEEWDFTMARRALDELGVDALNGMIRKELRRGQEEEGEIAFLTSSQARRLAKLAEE